MSELREAVQAEIAAHTPAEPPPFGLLAERRRRRDRRRAAAAGATVSALAVAAAALVPGALLGGRDSATTTVPAVRQESVAAETADDAQTFGFRVQSDGHADAREDTSHEAVARCFDLPGVAAALGFFSSPMQWSVRVTGRDNAAEVRACVEAVPGWTTARDPSFEAPS